MKVRTVWLNIRDVFRFIWGCIHSFWLLLRIKPDRIFIKGGYVGLPVGIAAWVLRIPFVIHESDAALGLTNRILARLTPYRLSGFDITGFKNLGNPIRESILQPIELDRASFSVQSDKPIVLATGGSLGSSSVNGAVIEMADLYSDFEIIHIYGRSRPEHLPTHPHYHPYEFLTDEMAHALQLADVVVTRAGANTLSELAALGKPSVVIPHPNLTGDHQSKNAQQWQEGIKLLPQSELDGQKLQRVLSTILQDKQEFERLRRTISSYARPTAADDIADYIIQPDRVGESSS